MLPEEEYLLSPTVASKRRLEFTMGRVAAREAITKLLGTPAPPILKGPNGEPVWPVGIVGSIAHTTEQALAIVAKKHDALSLGIDMERLDRSMDLALTKKLCTPEESNWVHETSNLSEQKLRFIFCAKEAVYKALFPLTGSIRGFLDVAMFPPPGSLAEFQTRAVLQIDWGSGWDQRKEILVNGTTLQNHLVCWVNQRGQNQRGQVSG